MKDATWKRILDMAEKLAVIGLGIGVFSGEAYPAIVGTGMAGVCIYFTQRRG
jgi:hypothetical protein